jgi:hypothetical protein
MAKFSGKIGYGLQEKTRPGVWEDVIIERQAYGDVLRTSRLLQSAQKVNDDLAVSNTISILMDAWARENFFAIRYIVWRGGYWTVSNVAVEDNQKRLTLQLGGVYNGPKPE